MILNLNKVSSSSSLLKTRKATQTKIEFELNKIKQKPGSFSRGQVTQTIIFLFYFFHFNHVAPPLNLAKLGGGDNAGNARNALLQSIQQGAKLKKVQTVDKSGPMISGKVATTAGGRPGSGSGGGSNHIASSHAVGSSRTIGRSSSKRADEAAIPNGPKLGGLFEGMATMPRLKPVGGRGQAGKSCASLLHFCFILLSCHLLSVR